MRSGVAGASKLTTPRCPPAAPTASRKAKKQDKACISGGSALGVILRRHAKKIASGNAGNMRNIDSAGNQINCFKYCRGSR